VVRDVVSAAGKQGKFGSKSMRVGGNGHAARGFVRGTDKGYWRLEIRRIYGIFEIITGSKEGSVNFNLWWERPNCIITLKVSTHRRRELEYALADRISRRRRLRQRFKFARGPHLLGPKVHLERVHSRANLVIERHRQQKQQRYGCKDEKTAHQGCEDHLHGTSSVG
jgi:hypothetical protein